MLVLLTCRPHFQPAWHHRSYLTEITVNRLSQPQIARMTTQVASGKPFPTSVLHYIVEKTDGVPLFVEELTKAMLESGHLKEVDDHYELEGSLRALTIPATLQDSLMARLDRLVTAKGIAQLAAVIGRQFAYPLLQTVSQVDEMTLQRELGRLVEAELVYQRGMLPQSTYVFKHALIQDAAYESLLKRTRQQYHQRIAQVFEEQFPETAQAQPELLAHHYTEAGCIEQAVGYWHKAGQSSLQRSAYAEAIAHLTQGLELLATLPDTPAHRQSELDMQVAFGAALMATKGHGAPEVERVYTRARLLCQQVGETPRLFDVLYGLRRWYASRGELRTALDIAEQLLRVAHRTQDTASLLESYYSLGYTLFRLGDLEPACQHLTQGIVLSEQQPERVPQLFLGRTGADVGLCCHSILACLLWLRGYPDQARQHFHEVLHLSQQRSHPYTHTYILAWTGYLHQFCREGGTAQAQAETLIAVSREHKYVAREVRGIVQQGWAWCMQGKREQGMAQIQEGLAAEKVTGDDTARVSNLALLAAAYGEMGQPETGLTVLTEALALTDTTGDRWYAPEMYRLKGELLLQQSLDNQADAETCFHHALDMARHQQAKSFELRTATSLARLWQSQGKREEARQVLGDVYGWFTEGFDTADLQDAKALLDELA
jgi:tetratricopeptide (TPR) repeat protein